MTAVRTVLESFFPRRDRLEIIIDSKDGSFQSLDAIIAKHLSVHKINQVLGSSRDTALHIIGS